MRKHGELKIMTAKEMVEMFILKDAQIGMDFATLDFTKKELNGIPSKYIDVEKVYEDAWGWNGIHVLENPIDAEETIIVIGHYGVSTSDVMAINVENLTCDCYGIGERIEHAVCFCDDEVLDDDTLLIVELHDEVYKRAREDEKIEQILKETKRKMVM